MKNESEKIRVLVLVDHALGITGPHRNVVGMLNALTARDDVLVLLLTGQVDPAEPYARSKNIKIVEKFFPHKIEKIVANLVHLVKAIGSYDIIYIPSGLKAFLYGQVLRMGKPLIAGPNVTPLPIHGKSHATRLEAHWMCDHWIEASSALEKYVLKEKVRRDRVSVVHHAIDLCKFSPGKADRSIWRKYGIPENKRIILHVGRFNDTLKGYNLLRDAWKRIAAQTGFHDWHLVLVGPGSVEYQDENDLPRCKALGKIIGDELPKVYASSDVFVAPSAWETFGFTVLEGMASGLPVIGSNVGGIKEQIDDQINGILVQLTTPESRFLEDAPETLFRALQRLLADDEQLVRLGKAAREKAVSWFSEERLGNDLISIFREQLKMKDADPAGAAV